MTSLLILAGVMAALFILKRLGFLPRLIFSWDLTGRILIYILLAWGILGVISKTWSIIVVLAHLPSAWLVSPSANPVIDIISTIAYVAALYGIYRWTKWGAYLIFVRLAFTMVIQVFVYHSLGWQLVGNYTGLDNLLADLSGGVTWLIAFALPWKRFR